MSDLPLPLAARLRRPGWRDTRHVVGILLVLGSVVLGSTMIRVADARSPVFTARSALVPGQQLTETDLVRVDVHLGALSDLYVAADAALAPHQVVLRAVPAGELVPRAAVGSQAQVAVQPLTLMVTAGAASTLQVGSEVDVYADLPAAAPGTGAAATFAGPELVLRRVAVSSLPENAGALGASTSGDHAVQIMVPTGRVKDVIGQVDRGARVTLVPVAGTSVRVDR